MYWGYGAKGEPGDRTELSRDVEEWILEGAPETVLVLLACSPEIIAQRMNEDPCKNSPLRVEDIERVLGRFREEFDRSRISSKIILDTSTAPVEETVTKFADQMERYLGEDDRLRMQMHSARQKAG